MLKMASYPQTSLVPHGTIPNKLEAFLLQGFSYLHATTCLFMCKNITKTSPPPTLFCRSILSFVIPKMSVTDLKQPSRQDEM